MSAVDEIYGASASAALQMKNNSQTAETEDRFLKLLVTQLQNQDPLNPMDNAEVTSQMAQLSTVNGIQQLNNTMLALSGQMDMSQSLQASGLINKDILYPGEKVSVGSSPEDDTVKSVTPFGIDLMSPAAKVEINILDKSGAPIYTEELGPQSSGIFPITWDGTDNKGAPVSDGAYSVEVKAFKENGSPVSAEALTYGHVSSVAYTTEGLRLNLSQGQKISLLDIRQVM